jgi:hypothetical protein
MEIDENLVSGKRFIQKLSLLIIAERRVGSVKSGYRFKAPDPL